MRPIPPHGTVSRYNSPKHKCHCDRCTKASNEYQRQRRATRPDVVEQNKVGVRKRQLELYAFVISLKEGKPCADCGIIYPHYVMHWDHLGKEKKLFNIAQMKHAKEKILAEIKKCELVCANCHAVRTHQRLYNVKKTIDIL